MKIYVFGNQDSVEDNIALQLIEVLKGRIENVEFVVVKPNEDLPFAGEAEVVVMDVVKGLKKVTMLTENNLGNLKLAPRNTAHDFDLGWQLKYLKKLGKLKQVRIIGIPMKGKVQVEKLVKVIEAVR